MKRQTKQYITVNVLLLGLCLLFFVYRSIMSRLPTMLSGCMMHDFFKIYCPLCGGTRAVSSLLQFDFVSAVRYNLFVVAMIVAVIFADIRAGVRLLKGKEKLFLCPLRVWIAAIIFFVLFAVLRNVFMIWLGYDPTGDLGVFWNHI